MMRHESVIVFATVRTLKLLTERSQSVLRSYIWPPTKRNACSELSAVVEDPTIIPAALCPGPAALLAELIVPPRVPRSVRVKLNCASARVIAKSRKKNAARLKMFLVFIEG
jgi:hypothetical protein